MTSGQADTIIAALERIAVAGERQANVAEAILAERKADVERSARILEIQEQHALHNQRTIELAEEHNKREQEKHDLFMPRMSNKE